MYFRHFVLVACIVLLSGCGVIDYFFLPPPEDTAQELYEGANDAMREKNYTQAATYYMRLKDNFPFSPYTVEAELALGDALFLDEKYPEAAEAYKDFESLHPRHEAIPYVLYQVGMADLKSFISVDRPTTAVQEAIEYFGRLRESYPGGEYAQKAEVETLNGRRIIAEHELYLGDVFWNMNKFGPAWKRYTYIVENFSDVKDVSEHAREKSLSAYYKYRDQ
ncbi:MAG: outer membrane protein assembly factor BamD, partial [Bilophila sp.]